MVLGQLTNKGYIHEVVFGSHNLSLDNLILAKLPFSARLEAFENKAIAALWAGEPFISQSESLGYTVKLVKYEDYVPGYQISCLFFSPNLTVKNPEIGNRFMISYLKGIKQYNKGKTDRNLGDSIRMPRADDRGSSTKLQASVAERWKADCSAWRVRAVRARRRDRSRAPTYVN